jgi:hypothetical protein
MSEGVYEGGPLTHRVVRPEGLVQRGDVAADLSRQVLARVEELHEAARGVVLAVPLDELRGLVVQHQAVRALVEPHLAGDVVALAELVGEAVAVAVEQDAAGAAERLGREELHLRVRLLRVDDAGRVNLERKRGEERRGAVSVRRGAGLSRLEEGANGYSARVGRGLSPAHTPCRTSRRRQPGRA